VNKEEKYFQQSITLRRLAEEQQNKLSAQYDLISLQRKKIQDLEENVKGLVLAIRNMKKEGKGWSKEVKKEELYRAQVIKIKGLKEREKVLTWNYRSCVSQSRNSLR